MFSAMTSHNVMTEMRAGMSAIITGGPPQLGGREAGIREREWGSLEKIMINSSPADM